jgi:hypothetical protein
MIHAGKYFIALDEVLIMLGANSHQLIEQILEFNQELPFSFLKVVLDSRLHHAIAMIRLLLLKIEDPDWAEPQKPLNGNEDRI